MLKKANEAWAILAFLFLSSEPVEEIDDLSRKDREHQKASEANQEKDDHQLYSAVRKPPSSPGARTDNTDSIVPGET